jgi:hypothetical protein
MFDGAGLTPLSFNGELRVMTGSDESRREMAELAALMLRLIARAGGLTLVLIAAIPTSMADTDPRAQLDFFRGLWTVKEHEATYREVCDWLRGGGFVVCNAEDRSDPTHSFSLSVFGYSVSDAQYTYSGFSSSGAERTLRGSLHESTWRFHGGSDRGPNWRRWQVTIVPTSTGFHFREEVSDRSGPWRIAVEIEYLRVPDGPK